METSNIPPNGPVPHAQRSGRAWDVLCHLASIVGLVASIGILGNIIGPLIIWLIKRGDSPSVDAHGRESLNFQISMTLYTIGLGILAVVLFVSIIGILLLPVVIGVLAVLWLVDLVFVVIASVKASDGEFYRYPATIRFL